MMKTTLNRIYRFSSSHRLQVDSMSEGKNLEIYDKCNNFHGHGHDYTLEVAVCAEPDKKTGMILPLEEFDAGVAKILKKLDYHNLDKQVDFFRSHVSTGENIIGYLWAELNNAFPPNQLYHLKLWETNNNYFELGKEI